MKNNSNGNTKREIPKDIMASDVNANNVIMLLR